MLTTKLIENKAKYDATFHSDLSNFKSLLKIQDNKTTEKEEKTKFTQAGNFNGVISIMTQ